MRIALLPMLAGCAWATTPPPSDPSEVDCGLVDRVIPEFLMEDVNPDSPAFNQSLTRADLVGTVSVMYWANAT